MLFQVTTVCFNGPHYITLHSVINMMTENGAKMTQNAAIIVLSYYYLSNVRKGLLQAHHDRCCSLVKLLSIYFRYFNLFNHG